MARQLSTRAPTKTKLTLEQQIPMNAVLEMVQRMAGVSPPPPYEPRNRGTKAARAANRKKKALNLPPTPTPDAPTTNAVPTTSSSSAKPTRTITSASIHVDNVSNPANPAMSFEFTFGQVPDAAEPSVPATKGRRRQHGRKGASGVDLREFIDPLLTAGDPEAKEKIDQQDDASYEREAERIWEQRIREGSLCHCRKERILERLQKHKENLQHVNDLLKARVMAYQAFGDHLTTELDNRDLGIVLVVTETPGGKADMKFKIEKKPEEVVG